MKDNEPIRVLNMFTIMNRGGAETMVMNYYRNIDRSKVQFDFLVHRKERGEYDDEIESMGGRIYRMPPIYPQNFLKYKQMIKRFFREHPEYLIIHSHMSELGYFAFREAKRQGIPIRICHAHNAPHGWDIKMLVRVYFKTRMMPYLTHLFTCGMEAGKWLYGERNQNRFIQLNNAIDASKFRLNPKLARDKREELNISKKYVIGHVGRFEEQKNHMFLLHVFREVVLQKPDAVLVLVGNGSLKPRVEKKAEELGITKNIMFLGSRDDVHEIMQTFDVFVFPSLYEGFPVTLVEAQAAGNLCIISAEQPKEAILTENVRRVSLRRCAKNWADYIVAMGERYEKYDTYEILQSRGYDIVENAAKLQEFYLEQVDLELHHRRTLRR